MADALTPEQRARRVLPDMWKPEPALGAPEYLSSRCSGALRDAIASAIRAAEAAAVEAERARCADIAAKPIQAMIREKHKQASSVVSAQVMSVLAVEAAVLEEAVEKVAAAIRTPTTEPSHDR
jgi:hypothetical protein